MKIGIERLKTKKISPINFSLINLFWVAVYKCRQIKIIIWSKELQLPFFKKFFKKKLLVALIIKKLAYKFRRFLLHSDSKQERHLRPCDNFICFYLLLFLKHVKLCLYGVYNTHNLRFFYKSNVFLLFLKIVLKIFILLINISKETKKHPQKKTLAHQC